MPLTCSTGGKGTGCTDSAMSHGHRRISESALEPRLSISALATLKFFRVWQCIYVHIFYIFPNTIVIVLNY